MFCEPQLRAILDRAQPDVIVEDNVNAFPALLTHGAPWVRIMSCNPLEMKDPDLPPTFSGYPEDDPSAWDAFRAEYERTHRASWERYDAFMADNGAPPLPELEFIHASPHLNLYVYPEELDYRRSRPLDGTWHRLESCVRSSDADFVALADPAGNGTIGIETWLPTAADRKSIDGDDALSPDHQRIDRFRGVHAGRPHHPGKAHQSRR